MLMAMLSYRNIRKKGIPVPMYLTFFSGNIVENSAEHWTKEETLLNF